MADPSCLEWQLEAIAAGVANIDNFRAAPTIANSGNSLEVGMAKRMNIRTGTDMGRAVVEVRRAQGLSARETAERTGLSPQYLSKIEAGRTTKVLEHQLRVLRRLGATISVEFPDDDR